MIEQFGALGVIRLVLTTPTGLKTCIHFIATCIRCSKVTTNLHCEMVLKLYMQSPNIG